MDFEVLADFTELANARNGQTFQVSRDREEFATRRPWVIFGLMLDNTVAGFIFQNLFAASAASLFEDGNLHVYYRDDRPFKREIARMVPNLTREWVPAGNNALALDYFNGAADRPARRLDLAWDELGAAEPDLIMPPNAMTEMFLPDLGRVTRFRIPDTVREDMHRRLLDRGVDPNAWFCVLHYRERTYATRPADPLRDIGKETAQAMVAHIVRDLGGQVVRIGHSDMDPVPPIDGYVDISTETESAMTLHAYAVSRARFFLELSPSGPMALAAAFATPLLRCNVPELNGTIDETGVHLPQHIIAEDGRRVPQDLAIRKGILSTAVMRKALSSLGFRYRKNSIAELKAAVGFMVARTHDCLGWRTLVPANYLTFPNQLPWPPKPRTAGHVIEFPELMNV